MGKSTLGISEILDKLKNEFEQIEKASENKPGKYGFDVKAAEIEISFIVTKKAKGGVNLVVVQAGGEYDKGEIHKIKLELEPYKIEEPPPYDDKRSDYENWKIQGGYDAPRKIPISLKKAKRSVRGKRVSLKRKSAKRKSAKRKSVKRKTAKRTAKRRR